MATAYRQFTPFPMIVGDEINLDGAMWTCIMPCTVVGSTLEDHLPVLRVGTQAQHNQGELVRSEGLTGGTPSQVPIEATMLRQYIQVGPNDIEEIEGKKILNWKFDFWGGFTILFQDLTYLKMDVTSDYDGPKLVIDDLDMSDLFDMGRLSSDIWDKYLSQKKIRREALNRNGGEHQLDAAISELGIERVRELVSKTAPEN
jgi:hypothetical protein